ncbi:MAG: hypothetical protein JNK85_23780, partial [Verrucomicrobiales bacterium]|nr:hypothetical protein [Verrucomicrobiales bacterium]
MRTLAKIAALWILLDFGAGSFEVLAQGTESTAADPRHHNQWEEAYQARLQWWSLRPLVAPAVPRPTRPAANPWPANEVDAFILAGLQARGLSPAPLADARARARRLS